MDKAKIGREPFISGSALKLIAMAIMLLDHFTAYILSGYSFFTSPFLTILGKEISIYYVLRMAGRLAFPIFAFLLVEGFLHTKNREKYGKRLLLFALISELPWNFAHTGRLLYGTQNVMFTLFFGFLALCALEYFAKDYKKLALSMVILFIVCAFGRMDYGARGLGLILILYLLRKEPLPRAILSSCMLPDGWAAGFSFIIIHFYSGERGFMKGKAAKYIAYIFYPLHLLLLGILKYILIYL